MFLSITSVLAKVIYIVLSPDWKWGVFLTSRDSSDITLELSPFSYVLCLFVFIAHFIIFDPELLALSHNSHICESPYDYFEVNRLWTKSREEYFGLIPFEAFFTTLSSLA